MIRGLGNMTEEKRLKEQGLFSLEKEKLGWGEDLVLFFKQGWSCLEQGLE